MNISTQPRSGKCRSLNESLVKHAMEHPNTNNVCPCPPGLVDYELVTIKQILHRYEVVYDVDEENKIITLNNGSSIIFKSSTDKPIWGFIIK